MAKPNLTYKDSGVDIKKADDFIKRIKPFVFSEKGSRVSAFGSLFNLGAILKKYKSPIIVSSTDGVGTKLKIAQQLGIHNTVGIDLVAMNVNDVICLGAKPLFFLDYVACGQVNPLVLREVIKGVNKGLKEANCLLLGGETAEMPGMYKYDEYDLAGFCVGIVDKGGLIDGKDIKDGDIIIGLESSGLHSNGFSLVRKVLALSEMKEYSEDILKPTRIYVKSISAILSAFSCIKGIAHITGGAFYNKAIKILPKGLGMVIDRKKWKIPEIFKIIQTKGKIEDKEMYTVFNMGIGMIIIASKNKVEDLVKFLGKMNSKSYVIGSVVKSNKSMLII